MTDGSAGWNQDPYGRHELRYFDGTAWTEHVSDGGAQGVDPPGGAPAPPSGFAPRPVEPAPAPRADRAGYSTGTNIAVFGGSGLLVLGAFLPWVEADLGFISVEKNGIDGDGVFTLLMGGAAILLFWLVRSTAGRVLTLVAGIGATGVAFYDVVDVQQAADELSSRSAVFSIEASVGVGLWMSAIGAIALVIGALLALRETAEKGPRSP